MLRSDRNILVAGGITKVANSQTPRGYVNMDSAWLVLYKADGVLVGTVFSLPVYRDAALANGKFEYYDEAANLLASN